MMDEYKLTGVKNAETELLEVIQFEPTPIGEEFTPQTDGIIFIEDTPDEYAKEVNSSPRNNIDESK